MPTQTYRDSAAYDDDGRGDCAPPKSKQATVKSPITHRTVIRTKGGFAAAEEIAWQAMRRTMDNHEARMYYHHLAATARYFHVQLNLTDRPCECLLPDNFHVPPANQWTVLTRAERELDLSMTRAAMTLAQLALRGKLTSARIEIEGGKRLVVGIMEEDRFSTEEREWVEEDGPAIEEEPIPSSGSTPSLQEVPAQPVAVSDDDLGDFAAVLRCLRDGKFRCVKVTYQIIEGSGLPGGRVTEILKHLQQAGRIRRLDGNRWVLVAVA